MGHSTVPMYISLITALLHFPSCYAWVYMFGLGIQGSAIATSITYFLDFLLIQLYVGTLKELKESWFFPDKSCFNIRGLIEFLKFGIPSAAMLCLEWWSFELMTFLSGYISVEAMAA
jgi:MATE family multidrug resistance protein